MRGLLLSLALLVPSLGFAARPGEIGVHVQKFGGINDSIDSAGIDDSDAAAAENVLTDSGYLETIPGMTEIVALGTPTIRNTWQYIGPSGTKYLIIHASSTIYQTDLSGSVVALSTTSYDAEVDAVTAFAKIFFVNGVDYGWYWDETSTEAVTSMPLAEYIEFADERLYLSNTSVSGSEVRISSYGSYSYWTVPSNVSEEPDAPNVFYFQRDDGEDILCSYNTPWGKFQGKRHSSHILKGSNNDRYYKRIVDPKVGCIDDRLVQMMDGWLYWAGVDGIYKWQGTGPVLFISRNLDKFWKTVRQKDFVTDSWTVNTQAQWQGGIINDDGLVESWNTVTTPHSIFPSSDTYTLDTEAEFDLFDHDGTSSKLYPNALTMEIATNTVVDGQFIVPGSWSSHKGTTAGAIVDLENSDASCPQDDPNCAYIYNGAIGPNNCQFGLYVMDWNHDHPWDGVYAGCAMECQNACSDIDSTKTLDLTAYWTSVGSTSVRYAICQLPCTDANYSWIATSPTAMGFNFYFDRSYYRSVTEHWLRVDNVTVSSYPYSATASYVFDTRRSTPVFQAFDIDMTSSVFDMGAATFTLQSSHDNVTFTNPYAYNIGEAAATSEKMRYLKLNTHFRTTCGTCTAQITSIENVAMSTGRYHSAIQYLGVDITSWKTGDIELTDLIGATQFLVRSATWNWVCRDCEGGTWPVYDKHTNHNIVGISTGNYFQFAIDSSSFTSSSPTLKVDRAVWGWNEGSGVPGASLVHDHRLFMCVMDGSDTVKNNTCAILQQNDKWTKMTGKNIASLSMYDNEPVAAGQDADAVIWRIMQDGVYSFGGDPISWFWQTKDFMFNGAGGKDWPVSEKVLNEVWIDAEPYSDPIQMTIGYAANKSAVYQSSTTYMDSSSAADYFNRNITMSDGYALGKYFRFRFSNNTTEDYNRLNAYTIYGEVKEKTQD